VVSLASYAECVHMIVVKSLELCSSKLGRLVVTCNTNLNNSESGATRGRFIQRYNGEGS
jgi:hypothetical protein